MSYTTKQELIDAFGEQPLIDLTDRATPPANAIDDAVLTRAIDDTDALIDVYVGARYQLPLAQTPPVLAQLAKPIVFHKLHIDAVSEKVQVDLNQAMKTLEWISTGKVKLNIAGVEPTTQADTVTYCAKPRTDVEGYCP